MCQEPSLRITFAGFTDCWSPHLSTPERFRTGVLACDPQVKYRLHDVTNIDPATCKLVQFAENPFGFHIVLCSRETAGNIDESLGTHPS